MIGFPPFVQDSAGFFRPKSGNATPLGYRMPGWGVEIINTTSSYKSTLVAKDLIPKREKIGIMC